MKKTTIFILVGLLLSSFGEAATVIRISPAEAPALFQTIGAMPRLSATAGSGAIPPGTGRASATAGSGATPKDLVRASATEGVTPAEAAHIAAAAESLPTGTARDTAVAFAHALADSAHADRIARLFDSSREIASSSEEDAEVPVAGENVDGLPTEALTLHRQFEKVATQRLSDFESEVKKIKSGRFGLALHWQLLPGQGLAYDVAYTFGRKTISKDQIEAQVDAGKILSADWETAKTEFDAVLPTLLKRLIEILNQNEAEHQNVHRQMAEIARQAAIKAAKERLGKGSDLQAWGLPLSISVDQKTHLRYANLYRLSGVPTDLGEALHDLIAPLVAADPHFLSTVTAAQLHEAVQLLYESLEYGVDAQTPDGAKKMRFSAHGMRFEGYDYPEFRESLVGLARQKLLEPPLPGDKSAGLAPVPEERQPSVVLKKIFVETLTEFQSAVQKKVPAKKLEQMQNLVIALHAAMGIPVETTGGIGMVQVRHIQLAPILVELRRRKIHDNVVRSVIRSFPLGESLLRLGIADLWAQGITGKGVKIALIDNGIDLEHPDLTGIKNPLSENLTRNRGAHTKGTHGTPMASIIHAIAPDAEIQSYQALSEPVDIPGVALSPREIDAAIEKALDRAKANGAQIISLSLGLPMGYANDSFAKKIADFAKAGVLVVVAAGNDAQGLPDGLQVRSPGTAPEAISVGAVDYHGVKADFSSSGTVFNPDAHTATEKPYLYAYGVNVKAAAQLPGPLYAQEPVPYMPISGTSPATPHVTGVIALMLQAGRDARQTISPDSLLAAVRKALAAAIVRIERLPVLDSAEKAVHAFAGNKAS